MSQTSVASAMSLPFPGVIIEELLSCTLTSAEASAEIPFGVMVQGGASDDLALLLAGAAATDLMGIVGHSHRFAKTNELGTSGLKPKVTFKGLRKGTLWVISEEAVTPQSTVRVRHTAGAGGTTLGQFRVAAVANETFNISSFARWRTSANALQPAKLEIDMTNASGVTADT